MVRGKCQGLDKSRNGTCASVAKWLRDDQQSTCAIDGGRRSQGNGCFVSLELQVNERSGRRGAAAQQHEFNWGSSQLDQEVVVNFDPHRIYRCATSELHY